MAPYSAGPTAVNTLPELLSRALAPTFLSHVSVLFHNALTLTSRCRLPAFTNFFIQVPGQWFFLICIANLTTNLGMRLSQAIFFAKLLFSAKERVM